MSRKIQAPGLEINEIDLSEYADTVDNSIVNTTVMLNGFTDKGIDYQTKYVNSMATFKKMFGSPTNEAETYLYNATNEVISRGGVAYVSKIPYTNGTYEEYSYTKYNVCSALTPLYSPYDIITNNYGILDKTSENSLYSFILQPNIDVGVIVTIIAENEDKGIIEVEQDERRVAIESHKINLVDYFDRCNINLTVITELFSDIADTLNFKYETRQAMYDVFYKDDGINCKNNAVYMLEKLNESVDALKNYVTTEDEKRTVEKYRNELNTMRDSLLEVGNLSKQIEHFGKSNTIEYYVDYLNYLSVQVSEKTAKGYDYKDIVLRIINGYLEDDLMKKKYTELKKNDETLTSYIQINSNGAEGTGFIHIDDYDKLKTSQTKVKANEIHIIDIKRNKYESEYNVMDKQNPMQYLGILPVITTPANALYYQKYIENGDDNFRCYNAVSAIQNLWSDNEYKGEIVNCMLSNLNNDSKDIIGFTQNIGSEIKANSSQTTLATTAASFFPNFTSINGVLDRQNIKKIGIVVFEMYIDKSSDYKIAFTPVESYVGSLNRYEIDQVTKTKQFIDDIVNQSSSRINVFSNVKFTKTRNVALLDTDKASTFIIANQTATSLGFYTKDCDKEIKYETINAALDRIFSNNNDINKTEFDLLVDAGVSNIAQFIKSVYGKNSGYFDFEDDRAWNFNMNDLSEWKFVLDKYDNFCKYIRKDCMFIADGMRPLCIQGHEKVVRNTKPSNTIENTVLKNIRYMSGMINSSYGAGYSDWFYTVDAFSNMYFWCPPSIKASGIYIYTDAYSNFWDAPAGLNRGHLPDDVIDVAFSPTLEEAGKIYNNNWNYAVSYPLDGIVQEGQKTFQVNKTALDRVNVRRLMLGLERSVRYVAKYFVYEGITDYMMQRFVDSITPIFENAKDKGGISEYFIKCDRDNNTIQTIENNELHCTIAIKPIKSLEFLVLNFICTNQSANVQEIAEDNM